MKLWSIYIRGILMGAADTVPGISGGTIAFITGIYERLIYSLHQIGWPALQHWRQQGIKSTWRYIDGTFLATLLAGVITSIITLAHLVSWLLETYPLQLNGFFFGLVASSLLLLGRQVDHWGWKRLIAILIGASIARSLPELLPQLGNTSDILFLIAGSIAICAMILPGISGSFLLLTMGLYGPVLNAVKSFDLAPILFFATGCGLGLLAFSRLLNWLFTHYHGATFATLVGFIIGALPQVWPWQWIERYRINMSDQWTILDQTPILPWQFNDISGQSPAYFSVILLMALGFILVYITIRKD